MVERIKLPSSRGSMVLAQHFIGRFEAIDCFARGALSQLSGVQMCGDSRFALRDLKQGWADAKASGCDFF